jgi:hypothetical protein
MLGGLVVTSAFNAVVSRFMGTACMKDSAHGELLLVVVRALWRALAEYLYPARKLLV